MFPSNKCFIIAEVGQAHDGSLGTAHAYIDAIAEAGADAVKFQTHIASAESTYDEPWRVKFSYQDESRYDYWRRMEFSPEQWSGLAQHAKERGLEFISSPFSLEAIKILINLKVKRWKIASGEIYNPELLEALWKTRLPMLFSSGMSSLSELDCVVEKTKKLDIPFGIFQCSSSYPTPPALWGLGVLKKLKQKYSCPVGLSDHSGKTYAALAAAALGADMIEVHVVFSKECFGPDVSSSLTMPELKQLVEGTSMIQTSLNEGEDKDIIVSPTRNLKDSFGRSVALKIPLPAGTTIEEKHLSLKKPSGGISPDKISSIIGKRLKFKKSEKFLLKWDDFEN